MKFKLFLLSSVFSFLFFLSFALGAIFGSSFRTSSPIGNELECTCAVCQPDRWCRKCGHKSRDCPKLSWYFKRRSVVSLTNRLEAVTNIVPIPLTFADK